MASGKYDSGYSFDSDHSDTWKQRHGGGTPVTLTADEQKLAGALQGRPEPRPAPVPATAPPSAVEPQLEAPVALARIILPLRSEPDKDGLRDCARGAWCAACERVTENGETYRLPARSYQPFCPRDRRLLEADLGQLPAQVVHLAAEIGNPVRNGQVIRVPFGPRIPIRLDIDNLMRAIVESVSAWHERIADAAQLSYPFTRLSKLQRQMFAVQRATEVLVNRVDAMLALDFQPMGRTRRVVSERDPKGRSTEDVYEWEDLDGIDAGMEIFTLRYLCRAILGETHARPEELVGVPCRDPLGTCGWRSVYRAELPSREGDPVFWTECARCGDRMTEDEYREWVALCAAYERNKRKEPATLENLPGVALRMRIGKGRGLTVSC